MKPTVADSRTPNPTPVMPILLKAGWIFFFNTEANTQQRPPPSGFVQVGFSEAVL
jgi:hypothetical protein